MSVRAAILADIDGTLIITGGAGARSWRLAFDELYGIPTDIGTFTEAGMTDPDVGRTPFEAAHAAGVSCVAVASHRFSERQPPAGDANYVIASLEEGLPL